jgi:hypothetical protein
MTDGLIPTHHEPVLGRSIAPKGTPPKNNASSTANARSSMDGQTVLGSDDQAASLSQVRAPAPRERNPLSPPVVSSPFRPERQATRKPRAFLFFSSLPKQKI